MPFSRADPPLGAGVNVVGTVNVFEAVRRQATPDRGAGRLHGVDRDVLAIGRQRRDGRLEEDAEPHPGNHYGVYKRANEGNARIYWQDSGVPSVGLRPMTVYGVGRDQGMTSSPTVAIAAAVLGRPFEITFGGSTLFQYAEDVAKTLLLASRSEPAGARVFNLGGDAVAIADWVAAIEMAVPEAAGLITVAPTELPFPAAIAHESLASLGKVPVTPYREGIAASAAIYRRLADGRGSSLPSRGCPHQFPRPDRPAQPSAGNATMKRLPP